MIALFLACVVWTALLLYRACPGIPGRFWGLVGVWLAVTAFGSKPPLVLLPPLVFIFWVLLRRQSFIDQTDLKILTRLHAVRIGVETVLWMLFIEGLLPKIMTFEGWNFDILAGATAVVVSFYAFRSGTVNRPLLGWWNVLALLLLINIVAIAILSGPTPFQRFGFGLPNMALSKWPYIWLPSFIVPAVFAAHAFVLSRWWRGTL